MWEDLLVYLETETMGAHSRQALLTSAGSEARQLPSRLLTNANVRRVDETAMPEC